MLNTSTTTNSSTKSTTKTTNSIKHKTPPNWIHFIAGGIGGAVAAFITCPLEALNKQSNLTKDFKFGLRTLGNGLEIWKTEGIRGLFKGLGPNLVGVAPARAIHFYTYTVSKKILVQHLGFEESSLVHITAATFAGVNVITITSPLWLIKTRMQLQSKLDSNSSHYYNNSLDCARKVFKEEGFRGFYKGLIASYVGISEQAIQFMLYEKLKITVQKYKFSKIKGELQEPTMAELKLISLTTIEYLATASIAKLIASIATYPHEVVRTRLREQRGSHLVNHKYNGFIQTLKLIFYEEGIKGLYGGMGAHLLRVVPNAAIMFMTYETVVKILSKHFEN